MRAVIVERDAEADDRAAGAGPARRARRARLRLVVSWTTAIALVGYCLPRAVNVSWGGVLPALLSVPWPAALLLTGLWLLGLYAHSFVLTAAAPRLTHRRALALNVTGSAVSNVVPLGGAAGIELNRRMMRAWGIDTRTFTGYTFLTNAWDVGAKLLLPLAGVVALVRADEAVTSELRVASIIAGTAFVGLVAVTSALLLSPRSAAASGRLVEAPLRVVLRLLGRDRELDLPGALLDIRRQCVGLVAGGWLRMSLGIIGYVLLQCLLLGFCLHLTGAGSTWAEVLAGFAVERVLTVVPITPGGVGVVDLGLVGVLIAQGGDPAGVTAAAVLYRVFVFAVEIPVGGGTLGLWLLARRLTERRRTLAQRHSPATEPGPASSGIGRVAHVSDVFLPRLGGIETLVDDLVSQQRTRGIAADVLTPTPGSDADPAWVRRMPASDARRVVGEYDVVHVHLSMLSPYGVSVARAAMAAGVPTLITVHSMWNGAGLLLRLAAIASLRRWPVAWSAVSGAAAETFRRSLPGVEVAVLPNAVDVASWRAPADAPADTPARTGQPAPVTIVSVMRLMPRKRPLQLVRIFERVRAQAPEDDVRLVIVGDGPLRRRVERDVRRRGLAPYVRITGRIPRDRVREELQGGSLYLAPAPRESFGIAALEARCAGLPVVAYRRSGIAEFIADRRDGVLIADDTEMAAATAELVRDQTLRARLTAHNRRVAPPYDWSSALERTDALYRRAAQCARGHTTRVRAVGAGSGTARSVGVRLAGEV